ncbi:proteoglycan 4-like isoform X2 [Colias croceus]|uniref:proteoglycan 4-like isoform X2 n=1 Tax=Colias crocea TaxID=72248 RepID=UPI001E28016E|nr:proteoglycan 4-like isoform X2 [Colias croceus]
MNSALKPVLPQPGVPQPGGQASPAKANVANANHAVGLPQGAQNSLHHGTNNLVGQNLTHHIPNTPPLPAHAVPSMAPVTANMAQMAQNMSHHGNLSHVTQNSVTPTNVAASPSKSASTSAPTPLSLVQDKANASQPLALTRTPEKKEPDSTAQANGTIDSPKSGTSAPANLKPQNPEVNKDKQDIAKTSPSTPKPPEKPASAPSTPQKADTSTPVSQGDGPAQPKVATANEPPEKSPSKPIELKPAQTADVAPTQSDSKPVPESANENPSPVIPPQPQKEVVPTENPKPEPIKTEENGDSRDVAQSSEDKPVEQKDKAETPKPEEVKVQKEEKPEEKSEVKTPAKAESKVSTKSTLKLATVTPPMRKRRQISEKTESTPAKKSNEESTPDTKSKRNRTKVQLYQSPTPEIAMATKLSASAGRSTPTKQNDDKLIVFYKNEYLAVRNAEGGFYVCQALQNVYRTTRKIKIRWLSQDKADPTGETYKPDFYDVTDMECVLTTLSLTRSASGGGAWLLRPAEQARATSILQRALRAEQSGANCLQLTEEHPDGHESQLDKKSRKRTSSKSSPRGKDDDNDTSKEESTPSKKARTTPKRSPRSAKKSKSPKTGKVAANKAKSSGSSPIAAVTSKVGIVRRIYRNTATAVTEKATDKKKNTPAKKTPTKPAKVETPTSTRKGRRAVKETKSSPIVPTPSTSTGKTTRTPRKPPSKK